MNRRSCHRQKQKSTLPRRLVGRQNPLEFMEPGSCLCGSVSVRGAFFIIVSLVYEKLERCSNQSSPLPVLAQILVALRYLATGSYYRFICEISNEFIFACYDKMSPERITQIMICFISIVSLETRDIHASQFN